MPYRPIRRREDIPQRPDVGMAAMPTPRVVPAPPNVGWTPQSARILQGLRRQPRQVLTKPKAPGYSLRHDFQRGGLKEVAKGLGNIWTEASKPFLQGPLGPYISGEAYTPEWKQYQTDARSAQTKLREATGKVYIPPADVPAAMRRANLTPSEMAAAYRAQEELKRMGLAAARMPGVTRSTTLPQLMDLGQERGEALLQRGQYGREQPTGLHSASAVSRFHPTLGQFRPYGWLHFIPHSRIKFANWLDSYTSKRQLGPGEQIDPKHEVIGAPGQVIRFNPRAWEHEIPLGTQARFMSPGTEEQHAAQLEGINALVDRTNQLLAKPEVEKRRYPSYLGNTGEAIEQLRQAITRIFNAYFITDTIPWKLYRSAPTPANAKGLLEAVRDDLVKAQQFALQRIPEPEPIRNIPIEELITTGLEGSPYGQYFKPGEKPKHPMNEVIANYGMPRIPAGWPPGYEVRRMPEGSLSYTTHVLIMPGGGEGLPVSIPIPNEDVSGISLEQTRLNTWQDYLRENPGALSVPSTQRVAGVYGPRGRIQKPEGSGIWWKDAWYAAGEEGLQWREIAEELGVPFIETGK